MVPLSKRSASSPPSPDSKKNGAIKTAPATVTSASPSDPPIWYKMTKTRTFLRKLSLKAEKNCVQNKGAKRRVASSENMAKSPFSSE